MLKKILLTSAVLLSMNAFGQESLDTQVEELSDSLATIVMEKGESSKTKDGSILYNLRFMKLGGHDYGVSIRDNYPYASTGRELGEEDILHRYGPRDETVDLGLDGLDENILNEQWYEQVGVREGMEKRAYRNTLQRTLRNYYSLFGKEK